MENVIGIGNFKFNSLRKYMTPIYAEMNLHLHDSMEEKQAVYQNLVPNFFKRMREYRGISIEDLAQRFKLNCNDLEGFERGLFKSNEDIVAAYVKACCGHYEFDYFNQQVREFRAPSCKDQKPWVVREALRRGFVLSGIDYKKLSSENGVVLSFDRKSCE